MPPACGRISSIVNVVREVIDYIALLSICIE